MIMNVKHMWVRTDKTLQIKHLNRSGSGTRNHSFTLRQGSEGKTGFRS